MVNATTTWSTTSDEIRAYIGFHILMGINCLPEIRDYWVKDEKLQLLKESLPHQCCFVHLVCTRTCSAVS